MIRYKGLQLATPLGDTMADKNRNRAKLLNNQLAKLDQFGWSERGNTELAYKEILAENPWYKPSKKVNPVLLGADFEVSQDKVNHVAWLWFGVLGTIDTSKGFLIPDNFEEWEEGFEPFQYVEEFLELLYTHSRYGMENLCCFHNGSKYDVMLLLNYPIFKQRLINSGIMGNNTKITRLSIDLWGKKITFIDSLGITGSPIRTLGKELGYPKLGYDYDSCDTMDKYPKPSDIKYCQRDVSIMLAGVCNMASKYPWIRTLKEMPLTQAGIARTMVNATKNFSNHGCPVKQNMVNQYLIACRNMTPRSNEEVTAMTSAYYGGITFCNPYCQTRYYNNVWGDDFKSSYPGSMLKRCYPNSKFGFQLAKTDKVYNMVWEQLDELKNTPCEYLELRPYFFNYYTEKGDAEILNFIVKMTATNVRPREIGKNMLPWVTRNRGKNPTKQLAEIWCNPFADEPAFIQNNVAWVDKMSTWFCDVDIVNFVKTYEYDSLKLETMYYCRTPFQYSAIPEAISTALNWAGMRKNGFGILADGGDIVAKDYHITEAEKQVCVLNRKLAKAYKSASKIPINSMYGVLCTRLKYGECSLDEYNNIITSPVTVADVFDEMAIRTEKYRVTQNFYVGIYITAWSRNSLINYWEMISRAGGQFIACDTDSLYYTAPVDLHDKWVELADIFLSDEYRAGILPANPCGFGLFEMEHEGMEFSSNGKKFYIMKENGVVTTKLAGYPRAKATDDTNPIIYDYHHSGLSFEEWIKQGGYASIMYFDMRTLYSLRPVRTNVGKDVTEQAKGIFPIYSHYTLEESTWSKKTEIINSNHFKEFYTEVVDPHHSREFFEEQYLVYFDIRPVTRTYNYNSEYPRV